MPDEPGASPSRWPVLIVAGVFALYVVSYFLATSYMVRHPESRRAAAAWRPIPNVVRHAMFKAWSRIDPAGAQIVDSIAARPSPPSP